MYLKEKFALYVAKDTTNIKRQQKATLGFTLAEILITLGIIGAIAAMTIPNLMTYLRNKKLESQFKKTYAELNIATRTFYAQEASSVHDADVILYGNNNYIQTSTKILESFMKYYKGYSMSKGYNWKDFDDSKNITQENLSGEPITQYPCDESSVAIDMVGRLYSFDNTSTSYEYNSPDYGPKVCVDINGIEKPNRLGYDRFVFVFTANNAVVPYTGIEWARLSKNETNENTIAKYCSNSLKFPAHTCAYFALKNKSPIGAGTYWGDFLK